MKCVQGRDPFCCRFGVDYPSKSPISINYLLLFPKFWIVIIHYKDEAGKNEDAFYDRVAS